MDTSSDSGCPSMEFTLISSLFSDPSVLARQYEAGGASCLSVLTDGPHFGGSVDDLRQARSAVGLPVLRKDFTVAERDVFDTRLMGADCVLLIAAALEPSQLVDLSGLAIDIGLDVLVEIHDEDELAVAVTAAAPATAAPARILLRVNVILLPPLGYLPPRSGRPRSSCRPPAVEGGGEKPQGMSGRRTKFSASGSI